MGDFLKELGLAETRGTGVPKINRAMNRNGSPDAIFETDDDRTYFEVTLPIHEFFIIENKSNNYLNDLDKILVTEKDIKILLFCLKAKSRGEILEDLLGVSNRTFNYNNSIKHLVNNGLIALTFPDSLTAPNQSYFTTLKGQYFIEKVD